MVTSTSKRWTIGILNVGSLVVIGAGMAAIDKTFQGGQLFDKLQLQLPTTLTLPDLRVQHLASVITTGIGLPRDATMPLMFFASFAVVLFVLMFRW